ncbi:MAG: flagellar motor protein MotA [Alphaproteobacteria bacterium]|nr:flagellar motor protein MotA [Alphaproteobacteria bacterium]
MSYIHRYFLRMGIFLSLVLVTVGVLFIPLSRIFFHNFALNIVILSCVGLGVFLSFYKLHRLQQEQNWLDSYELGKERFPNSPKAKILAPLSILLSDPSFNGTLSPITARSVLSSVENRLDETRDLSRYLVGLLIFLGLLGTFWGLSETIGAITGVINGIDMGSGDVQNAFSHLKEGLQSPLSGMGMAFSSSMFGLASSLIIGFLDLQNTKASSEFFHNLEDRLAINTKIGGASEAVAAGSGPAYSMGLLEQTVESMANLQNQMRRSEDNRLSVIKSMQTLNEKLALLADQITAHQTVIKKIAQNQVDLQENIIQMAKNPAGGAHDEAIKHLLRNLDATSSKMLEELVEGRNRSTQELRTEIRVIARTLSAIANGQEVAA